MSLIRNADLDLSSSACATYPDVPTWSWSLQVLHGVSAMENAQGSERMAELSRTLWMYP